MSRLVLDVPTGHPGHPPLTSPLALLGWTIRGGRRVLAGAIVLGIISSLCGALVPLVLGRALDVGLADGLSTRLLWFALTLLAIGLLDAAAVSLGHAGEVGGWLHGSFTSSRLIGHHVTRTGSAIGEELPTGEVVNTVASDSFHIGNMLELLPALIGGLVAYATVAIYMLRQSVTLGLVVALGLPLVTVVVSLLIKPLHARQKAQRDAAGRLATLATDTVSGLRILRGIGGEDVFAERYRAQSQRVRSHGVRVAALSSLLEALQILLPGLFVAAVVWLGARLALAGEITPGELVSFYGFTAFLSQPLRWITHFINFFTRARVAARKLIAVLEVTPDAGSLAESEAADARPAPTGAGEPPALVDETTGLTVTPGLFTAVVTATSTAAEELAARLGRFDDAAAGSVLLDGVRLADLPLAEVRERIVVASATPQLFTGSLRTELDVRNAWLDTAGVRRPVEDRDVASSEGSGGSGRNGRSRAALHGTTVPDTAADARLLTALEVADAHDVLDSVPGRLDGEITEKGRSLSGGQRQRVALARALLTDAEVLVLVEPTSAVDAHTEARIAQRLAGYRQGRTTVVLTGSPLVLEHADEVVFLDDGRVRARGRHHDLLARATTGDDDAAAYHHVVTRATAATTAATVTDGSAS